MSAGTALKLTPIQWLICIIAVIGFAFDTYAPTKVGLVAAGVGFGTPDRISSLLLAPGPGPEPGKEEL